MGEPGSGRTPVAARWSALHHGIDPAVIPLLRPWLALMWWLAGPLARRGIRPTAVTVLGVVLALAAVALARPAPWVAGPLVLAAVVCDGLDGAIAVLADRATASGARADAIADRISDLAFATVLWRCGSPWWLAIAAGVVAVAVDGLRRVRRTPGRITVAERPSWTVCAVLACGAATISAASWPAAVCAAVWVGLGAIGLGQLAWSGSAQFSSARSQAVDRRTNGR